MGDGERPATSKGSAKPGRARREKALKDALKANLQRRKSQARKRRAENEQDGPEKGEER